MVKKTYSYELIGREMEVINSTNKSDLGIKGKIIDETKHTLKVMHQGKTKTLVKKNITFRLGKLVLEGKDLAKRPEERIKS